MAAHDNPSLDLDPRYDHYDYPTTSPEKKSGHPGHTTKEQDAQVHQLRMALEQMGYKDRLDTLTLLRFLRARKFNVEQAKQMFIDCEKWRKEFGVDYLIRNFKYEEKPQVFQYYPQYYHKTDKDGRPVYIEQLGKIDLNALYKITTGDRMLQHLVVEYEKVADPRLPACSRRAGRLLETCCTIMDLKGVGFSNMNSVYGYVKQASAISQNYYPERLGRMYLINAPWGFSSIFSMVKGFLDPVTVEKIHILGGSYQGELLKQIPAENLPKQFGGQCDCPGGCAMSDLGPWQDPEWAKPPKWAQEEKPTPTADASTANDKQTTHAAATAGNADGARDQPPVPPKDEQGSLKPTQTSPANAEPASMPSATATPTTTSGGASVGAGGGNTTTVSIHGGVEIVPPGQGGIKPSGDTDSPPAPMPGTAPAPMKM